MQKKLTAAERIRKSAARNAALASKKAGTLTLDEAQEKAITGAITGESSARVYAVKMREEYGPGWYRLLDAEPNGDNEKAIKKALGERRTACRNRMIDKGASNVHKAWSDMLKEAKALDNPYGETREKKPLTARVREDATAKYKAIMKAEAPSEVLMEANRHYAAILALFNVDISAINAKL